jgi:phosphoribosylformylglycinamidine cyclo-ligase
MKYLPGPMKVIKDNLFDAPEIFKLIQQSSGSDDSEMYQVFNMGHRLEIFTDEATAAKMIGDAKTLNIDAQIIGHTEASDKKELRLKVKDNWIVC